MKRPNLSDDKKNRIVHFLLQNSSNGKPSRGKMAEARIKFVASKRTVSRLWKTAMDQQKKGQVIHLIGGKKLAIKRKRVNFDLELIQSIELFKRSSVRRLSFGINVSKSTVWRWVKEGKLRAHTSAIKPDLTAPNKLLRLRFSLVAIEVDNFMKVLKFKSMYNTIHVDEKWFHITKTSRRFYMTATEPEPHRTCKSKNYIGKVMFVCAVCRPIFDENGTIIFDGKIGIFPLVQQVPAKRNNKNRPAGTLETKPIESINRQVMKSCFINQLIPAIMERWPLGASKHILIQQDNAKPHIFYSDPEFRASATKHGFDIRLVQQPPNSPDTNINDLGWFRAIESIQIESACYNVDELVAAVIDSFEELCPTKLNKVFLSLQGCMVKIMKVKGQNNYKIPHMGKDALARQGRLPINLEVPEELVRECISYLLESGTVAGLGSLMEYLGIQQG